MAETGPVTTELIIRARAGDDSARRKLEKAFYREVLRACRLARRTDASRHDLQTTDLAHEVIIRLNPGVLFEQADNRHYVHAAVATAILRVLVDLARARRAAKRKGRLRPLDDVLDRLEADDVDVVVLEKALQKLEVTNLRQADVIRRRFFLNDPVARIAKDLGLSVSAIEKDIKHAKAYLYGELRS